MQPKGILANRASVWPVEIAHSALIESAMTSSGAVATDCSIHLGWKPTAATAAPLNDMTAHYLITIRYTGGTVTVWKQGTQLAAYGGSVGSTYAEMVQNVLTYYAGSHHGYFSRLIVVESALDYTSFIEPSTQVTGLWVPKKYTGDYGTNGCDLDFSDATDLGKDAHVELGDELIDDVTAWDWDNGITVIDLGTDSLQFIDAAQYSGGKKDLTAVVADDRYVVSTNVSGLSSGGRVALRAGASDATGNTNRITVTSDGAASGTVTAVDARFVVFALTADCSAILSNISIKAITAGANDWSITGTQSDDTPTHNGGIAAWKALPNPTIMRSSTVVDVVLRAGTGGLLFSGGTISGTGSSFGTNYDHTKVFDGSLIYGSGAWNAGTTIPGYAQYDLGEGNSAVMIRYRVYADSQYAGVLGPKDWTVQGSNDGVTWDVIHTVTSAPQLSINGYNEYTTGSSTAYRMFKLYVSAGYTASDMIIGEWIGYCDTQVDTLEFQPDLVNIKSRNYAQSWAMFDSVRGPGNYLSTDSTGAPTSDSDSLLSFDAGGYGLGVSDIVNRPGTSFLDLCIKAGVEQGFEIVPYVGDGVYGRKIPHTLGKAPTFMLVRRLGSCDWVIYHAALGASSKLTFSTDARSGTTLWAYTEPTATDITVGDAFAVNSAGGSYIAYLFTDSDIFKAFSYIGNASTDGPMVDLGGKPLSIPFWRNSAVVTPWYNVDAARNENNPVQQALRPNAASAEESFNFISATSTGFKCITSGAGLNGDGQLTIGLAILEAAAKYTNAF